MSDSNDIDGEEGGEAACYAHLICPFCGVVSPAHRVDCENRDDSTAPMPSEH
jgi:hypothetical protein